MKLFLNTAEQSARYQHRLKFKTTAQAKLAVCALLGTNILVMNVKGSRRCRSIVFQTPYVLGPVTRGGLCCGMQPTSAVFNRESQTWKKVPFIRRVTLAQVGFTLLTFLVLCGNPLTDLLYFNGSIFSFDLWNNVVMGLFFTICVAWISPDILGLMQSHQRREVH